jgi:hypothetical protein
MPLSKFLDPEINPACTWLSILVTTGVEILLFAAKQSFPNAGWGGLAILYGTAIALVIGTIANSLLGIFARRRNEYWGGRIALSGIALWLLTIAGFVGLPYYRAEQREHAKTWGATGGIADAVVQADGKVVLLGPGIVRLLFGGGEDALFHRYYSLGKKDKGGPFPDQWWTGSCALSLPGGDLLLAAYGRISRITLDGRDGTNFSVAPSNASCWGFSSAA